MFFFDLAGVWTFIFIIPFMLLPGGFRCFFFFPPIFFRPLILGLSFFSNINMYSYKFPSNHHYSCILQMLMCFIFITIQIAMFSIFSYDFFFDSWIIFNLQIFETFLDILLLISILILLWSGNKLCMISIWFNLLSLFYDPDSDLSWWITYTLEKKVVVGCSLL